MEIRPATIEELVSLNEQIEEFGHPYDAQVFDEKLAGREWLGLIAVHEMEPLGFKVGYAESETTFYSWLGGVIPAGRRRGVARRLLQAQEVWVIQQGYREITVKSRNRFVSMVQLLLSEGYQISGVEPQAHIEDNRLWFCKRLPQG